MHNKKLMPPKVAERRLEQIISANYHSVSALLLRHPPAANAAVNASSEHDHYERRKRPKKVAEFGMPGHRSHKVFLTEASYRRYLRDKTIARVLVFSTFCVSAYASDLRDWVIIIDALSTVFGQN